MKKVIVGVSGGPDSMYLLYKLYKKKSVTPVVAHINYNFREESVNETKLVRKFCDKNNIELYVLDVDQKILNKYNHLSNKQQMAREIRYDFFIELANKVKAETIYIAHHKDDFIETAIMQEKRSSELPFYGIETNGKFKGLIIKRPLLKEYKDDILVKLENKRIPFLVDQSNFSNKYERNRIRINLSKKTTKEKKKIYKHFQMINKSNESSRNEIQKKWIEFETSDFDRSFLLKQNEYIQFQLMIKLLIKDTEYIKINKNKVNGCLEFIKTKKGKEYRLMDNIFLIVKDSRIKIYNK